MNIFNKTKILIGTIKIDDLTLQPFDKKIISLTDFELLNMAKVSVDLSKKFSPDKWVNSLNLMCK